MTDPISRHRVYRVRLYPTPTQHRALYQQATAQRFVWNWALGECNAHYEETGKRLRAVDLNVRFTRAKREREDMRWLDRPTEDNPDGAGISVPASQMTFRDLDNAFKAFFAGLKAGRRVGFPRFKSKHATRPSFAFPLGVYCDGDNRVHIPNVGKVRFRGYNGVTFDRSGEATITLNPAGQWHLSKLVRDEIAVDPVTVTDEGTVGLDRGIRRLVTTSDGEHIDNPKHLARIERKLKRLDKALSRKQPGSKRRERARLKRAKAYNNLANARREHLHEISTRLVREHDAVILGDRDIPAMIRQAQQSDDPVSRILQLPKRINDASWGELGRQLAYKGAWSGKPVVVLDPAFPATITCHVCGTINPQVSSLTMTEWTCPHCGTHHDIDVNAAMTIKQAGLRKLRERVD